MWAIVLACPTREKDTVCPGIYGTQQLGSLSVTFSHRAFDLSLRRPRWRVRRRSAHGLLLYAGTCADAERHSKLSISLLVEVWDCEWPVAAGCPQSVINGVAGSKGGC
jgi:hypothetical protein